MFVLTGSNVSTYCATNRSLFDSYFPTYGAFQRRDMGFADGIMCAMSELSVDGGVAVPSCGNKLLLTYDYAIQTNFITHHLAAIPFGRVVFLNAQWSDRTGRCFATNGSLMPSCSQTAATP
jgi:hypothetical protein